MRAAALLLFALTLTAVEVPAVVLGVTDGDTIRAKLASGAEAAKAGAWLTVPQWMRDKGNERTAPKR